MRDPAGPVGTGRAGHADAPRVLRDDIRCAREAVRHVPVPGARGRHVQLDQAGRHSGNGRQAPDPRQMQALVPGVELPRGRRPPHRRRRQGVLRAEGDGQVHGRRRRQGLHHRVRRVQLPLPVGRLRAERRGLLGGHSATGRGGVHEGAGGRGRVRVPRLQGQEHRGQAQDDRRQDADVPEPTGWPFFFPYLYKSAPISRPLQVFKWQTSKS